MKKIKKNGAKTPFGINNIIRLLIALAGLAGCLTKLHDSIPKEEHGAGMAIPVSRIDQRVVVNIPADVQPVTPNLEHNRMVRAHGRMQEQEDTIQALQTLGRDVLPEASCSWWNLPVFLKSSEPWNENEFENARETLRRQVERINQQNKAPGGKPKDVILRHAPEGFKIEIKYS